MNHVQSSDVGMEEKGILERRNEGERNPRLSRQNILSRGSTPS